MDPRCKDPDATCSSRFPFIQSIFINIYQKVHWMAEKNWKIFFALGILAINEENFLKTALLSVYTAVTPIVSTPPS